MINLELKNKINKKSYLATSLEVRVVVETLFFLKQIECHLETTADIDQ